jgi:hypothetical protein
LKVPKEMVAMTVDDINRCQVPEAAGAEFSQLEQGCARFCDEGSVCERCLPWHPVLCAECDVVSEARMTGVWFAAPPYLT